MITGRYGLESRWQWWLRLIASAVIVTGLHAGLVAYAYLQPPPEEAIEEPEGAFMMELAPIPVAAAAEAAEAPGPPAEATQQQVTEKTPTEEVPEVTPPKEEPVPLTAEPEPEMAMPLPKPVEEPKEEKEDEKPVEKQVVEDEKKKEEEPELEKAKPQEAMVQQSAPPSPAATPAPQTAARQQGTTERKSNDEISWAKLLVKHLGRHPPNYPLSAWRSSQQGEVLVGFRIDRRGQVVSARIAKSSKSAPLDQEALAVLHRAAPLPVPPDEIAGEFFDFMIPVQFKIR